LTQKKKEEEERRMREAEEKKQRDIEEKRRRLEEAERKRQAMMQSMKVDNSPSASCNHNINHCFSLSTGPEEQGPQLHNHQEGQHRKL
jgi:hypothetical protein